jgi:SAM-dependent methyltransferase
MESSVAANEARHAPLFPGVVDFLVADVVLMDCPPSSYDVVFSNWLLMYLSDAEVEAFARKALRWLAPGGVLFFRESCFRQSGDKARGGFNPTHYRNPRDYFAAFDGAAVYVDEDDDAAEGGKSEAKAANGNGAAAAANGGSGGANGGGSNGKKKKRRVAYFELDVAKCVDTYVAVKGNQNQICWRYVRREAEVEVEEGQEEQQQQQHNGSGAAPAAASVPASAARSHSLRALLDGAAYTPAALARYEWTFGGPGFVSPGGPTEARELLLHPRLALAEAVARAAAAAAGGDAAPPSSSSSSSVARVLDVGCGPGGGAFLAADLFPGGLHVHAVDLSVNCVLLALERAAARATAKAAAAQGAAAAAAIAAAAPSSSENEDNGDAALVDKDRGAAAPSEAPVAFGANVTLEVSDATLRWLVGPCPAGAEAAAAAAPAAGPFDAAVSRDALLHVRDKLAVLSRLRAWLRPGTGTLLITDYARPDEQEGEEAAANSGSGGNGSGAAKPDGASDDGGLAAYAAERQYHLETASGYERLLREAGFADVRVEDRTERLAAHLRAELGRLEGGGAAADGGSAAPFPGTEDERRAMVGRWRAKLARAEAGQQRWLLITARAP